MNVALSLTHGFSADCLACAFNSLMSLLLLYQSYIWGLVNYFKSLGANIKYKE